MARSLRRTLPAGLALALGMSLLMSGSALAATTDVSIVNFAFSPQTVSIKMGDSVKWTNTATITSHTTTSDGIDLCCPNGPALWASGTLAPNAMFTFTFNVAASYKYHCSIHTNMKGTVNVAMKAKPKSGGTSTVFTITWAKGSIPAFGYNADIQISRPGGPGFVDWMIDQTGMMVKHTFTPDAGTGTYLFRARLQMGTSTTLISGFSKSLKITVV
jgi:plastocyanin